MEWKLGEINYVKSHMETKHKRLLNMNEEDKKASIVNFFPTKEQLNTRPMSKANQELGETLCKNVGVFRIIICVFLVCENMYARVFFRGCSV